MQNIYEFNHIDKTLSEEKVKKMKDFYAYYHKNILDMKSCTPVFEEKILFVIFRLAN